MANEYLNWIKTEETSESTNGGGPLFVPAFYELLKDTQIGTLFEWCSGCSWIGIYLLEHGICENLVLADIDEHALDLANDTLVKKGLVNFTRIYHSDNLKDIHEGERFDVVVANPPNYFNIRKDHPYNNARDNKYISDTDFKLHTDFFKNIGKFLNKDARLYISEAEPDSKKIYLGHNSIPYDDRPFRPINYFKRLIESNGLKLNGVFKSDMRHNFDIKFMIDRLYPIPMLDENKKVITDFSILDISA